MFDEGRVVSVGDTGLFVSVTGRADGIPLVLLHGGLRSRTDFEPLAAQLGAEFRLVAIDSRGHGRSGLGQRPMSYGQMAQDVASVLGQLGLREAGLIGHSDGAIVALRLALSEAVAPAFIAAAGARWQLSAGDPIRSICRGLSPEGWTQMFPASVRQYLAENPDPDFAALFAATTRMWLDDGAHGYPGDAVAAIARPLLVIHGDDDALVSRKLAFGLAQRVAGARLLNLPWASHDLFGDSAADVVPALRTFIRRAVGEGAAR